MISPEQKQKLSELKNTPYGMALEAFLMEKCNEIDTVATCGSWEETLGRKQALKIIREIFAFMGSEVGEVKPRKNPYT